MWGVAKSDQKPEVVIDGHRESDAPFQLQFAPGVMIVDAEIRDQQSLAVFIATIQALGKALPDKPVEVSALPPPPVDVTPAASPAPITDHATGEFVKPPLTDPPLAQ